MNTFVHAPASTVPSWRASFGAQIGLLAARTWPHLLLFFLLMLLWVISPLFSLPGYAIVRGPYYGTDSLGMLGRFVFALVALFWGMKVWSDFPARERVFLRTLPLSRFSQGASLSAAGLLLLLAALGGGWLVGGLVRTVAGGWVPESLLVAAMPRPLWLVPVLSLVNAYLLGVLLAYWMKRPEFWLFAIILGLGGLVFLLDLLGWYGPARLIGGAGRLVLAGLGMSGEIPLQGGIASRLAPWTYPATAVMWLFLLLLPANVLSLRGYSEKAG